jgi:hypothetical protein
MVNRELFNAIRSVKKATAQAHYAAIDRIRSKYGRAISREEAAYIYAAGLGIDIYKYLRKENQHIQESVKQLAARTNPASGSGRQIQRKARSIKVLKVSSTQVGSSDVASEVVQNAYSMAKVYTLIFVFENTLRLFIKEVLDRVYPDGWWNPTLMPTDVYKKAEQRKTQEGKNLWHGRRMASKSMLDYVDLDELESILSKRADKFFPIFKDLPQSLDWLKVKIKEIYPSRNVVAHCNPLGKHDVQRVEVIVRDWLKQLPALKRNLNT